MKFRTKIELSGKTSTGMQVPESIVEGLGKGKRPAVSVTINGYTYRSTIASMGGVYMLPVSAEIRKNAGVAAGDEVEVTVELDTAPRELVLPDDFAAALNAQPEAKTFFDALSYSNRQRFVLPIEQAKTAETRQRRIEKAITMLREGRTA